MPSFHSQSDEGREKIPIRIPVGVGETMSNQTDAHPSPSSEAVSSYQRNKQSKKVRFELKTEKCRLKKSK
jgi:hypothetical protein